MKIELNEKMPRNCSGKEKAAMMLESRN